MTTPLAEPIMVYFLAIVSTNPCHCVERYAVFM